MTKHSPRDEAQAFKQGSPLCPMVAHLDDWIKYGGSEALMPDAYREAADIIITCIEEDRIKTHPDMYFFPIAYLYRHAIELNLKGLLQLALKKEVIEKSEELTKAVGKHCLAKLWSFAREVLEKVSPEEDKSVFMNAERLILEFDRLDPSGQNFRYAKDKAEKPTTEILPPSVDLSELKIACTGLFTFFMGCDCVMGSIKKGPV